MQNVFSEEILPFVNLTCVCSQKFKTGCFSVNLITPLKKETASKNALIPRVLLRGSSRYSTMQKMNAALEEMYGAKVIPLVRKKGEMQCVGFYATFVDDDFIPGASNNLEDVANLLGELLLSPDTQSGLLRSEYVEGEKINLINEINSAVNDKRSYAVKRLVELMCADEDYGVDPLGDADSVRAVNYLNLTKQYKSLISTSKVEIFYCGNSDFERVKNALRSAFMPMMRYGCDVFAGTDVKIHASEASPRVFDEEMDVSQSKLTIGFRIGECMKRPNYAAFLVFNALYGGSVTSKLFANVREKLSLCYYASSTIEKHKGIMVVRSGIEYSKYDEALSEILLQLDAIRNGDVTEVEFKCARRSVVNGIRSAMDTIEGLEALYFDQAFLDFKCAPEELAGLADIITLNEVIDVAKSVETDTIYLLHGKVDDENDAQVL